MGQQMYDYVSETATNSSMAVYGAISVLCIGVLMIVAKLCMRFRKDKTETQSIEAFAYDEATPRNVDEEEAEKHEEESARYHNLAGKLPTTPAIF